MQSKPDTIIGIDLGTTNSLVGIRDADGLRILKDGDSSLIPSVIVFDAHGKVLAVGHRAKTLKALDPRRIAYSVKRLLGKGKSDLKEIENYLPFDFSASTEEMLKLKYEEQTYTPIELSAEILRRCKFVAENNLGYPIRKAVVTVPAYFNESQRSATAMAGRLAGLEVVRIINEPTAAALAFGHGTARDSSSKFIAVYDFGGGTFDISILKVTGEIFEVLSTDGDTQLGGDDLDKAFVEWVVQKIGDSPQTDEDRILLISQIEEIKKSLTDHSKILANIHWGDKLRWKGEITRDELSHILSPVIEKTIRICERAMKAADLQVSELDDIILVGGSSRVTEVRNQVRKFFGKNPNTSVNPEEVVALGAAIQASILSGEKTETLLLDVVPLSLGLETMGGVAEKIIHRNSTIPASAAQSFTTYADNQTAVDLHIVQGERELVKDCRSLGRFKLKISPAPAGVPKIQVVFLMDANGMLMVSARDLATNEATSLEVKPSFGLSDREVERMLQEAWTYAEKDFTERQLIEAKNQATSLIQATEKSLKSPMIDAKFKAEKEPEILSVLGALREDLKSANADLITTRTQELDLATQTLAEHLITRSIQAMGH